MVLVTGGTGLVGSHLLYHLLSANVPVRAIHRKTSDLEKTKHVFGYYTEDFENLFNKIQWFEADINDIPALTEAFKDIDTVYHCAAFISFDPADVEKLRKINIEGTANIVNLCLSNKVSKLCHVSSVATLGGTIDNSLINENTEWNKETDNSVYAITKYGAEMEVWRGTQEGLPTVIVNPGIILGTSPHGTGSNVIVEIGASGVPFFPSGGMGIVDVQDVVRAMYTLMESSIENQSFVLVSSNVSYRELISKLAFYFGKKPPSRKLLKWPIYLFSSLDWFFSKLIGMDRRLPKSNVRSLFKGSYYNSSKIEKALGWTFTPIEETLERVTSERLQEKKN